VSWQGAASTLGAMAAGVALLYFSPLAKVVLWSPMRGRVLLNGVPAAGAVLVRKYFWHWPDQPGTDSTIADANGEFAFPTISGRMLLGKILPHEPMIEQSMTIQYQGAVHRAWGYFSHSYGLNGENGGHPIVVTCHLEAERAPHGDVMGICEFQ